MVEDFVVGAAARVTYTNEKRIDLIYVHYIYQ